jgi:hypothetical protein
MSDKYVLVCCKYYDVLLMEEDYFFQMCDVEGGRAKLKEDIFKDDMCGGIDTWLQGWAINHVRGWGIIGKFEGDNRILKGIYYLDVDL